MTLLTVPIIDIPPLYGGSPAAVTALAEAVDKACRDIGLLVITGHRVPASLIERVERSSRQFFELPVAAKMKLKRPKDDRGAAPMRTSKPRRSPWSRCTSGW